MLTTITINSVEPFAAHSAFGSTGAYERVKGVFRGELDPQDPRNRVIVNINKAPRNASGKVEYEADFFMLRPSDAARGNDRIIYDVTQPRPHVHPLAADGCATGVACVRERPENARRRGHRALPASRLHTGVERLGSRSATFEQRFGNEGYRCDRQWQTDRAPHPR